MPYTSLQVLGHLLNVNVIWSQFWATKLSHTGHMAITLCYSTSEMTSSVNTHSDASVRHSFNDNMLTKKSMSSLPRGDT
jgi:hypothetical protein